MSVYKRTYKVKTKAGHVEKREQKWFTIEVRHPETGKIIRRRGPRDEKSAKQHEAKLIRQLERAEVGLYDPYKEFRSKPFADSIKDFAAMLEGDARDETYIYICRKRLERISLEAGWRTLFDVTLRSWETWRHATMKAGHKGRKTKPKTINQFLATLHKFFAWCIKTGRIGANPLAEASKSQEVANEDYRRPLAVGEFEKFLAKLPTGELRRFYVFLAYTALRRSTLEGLKWDDLKLDRDDPHIVVRAWNNKIRRTQRFELRKDVAAMMAEVRRGASGQSRVFRHVPTIDEHKQYLAAAGIPFDENGARRLDLHAFRKTLHTWLEDAGVDVREASKALGHLHLSTTMKSYRERRKGRPEAGVEKLPALPLPGADGDNAAFGSQSQKGTA